MNKNILKLVLGIIILYIVLSLPRKYEDEINAVIFKNGDREYEKEIVIKINGYKSNKLFMSDKFKGKLTIDNKEYNAVELKLGTHQVLIGRDNNKGDFYTIGDILIDNDMSTLTINYHVNGSWSREDGLVISGPANNRKEALIITKKLYNNYSKLETINVN